MTVKIHEYADLLPMMKDDEFNSLVEDIKENGLREKIWLHEGKILDGRNRYKACIEADVEPQYRQFTGSDPLQFVLSLNIERRHLKPSQCAVIADDIKQIIAEQAKERQLSTLKQNQKDSGTVPENFREREVDKHKTETNYLAAQKVGNTNENYVRQAEKLRQSPEVREQVRQGNFNIPEAAKVAKLEPEKQKQVIDGVKQGEKASDVLREVSRAERIEKINSISSQNKELGGVGKYPVIYIDPPWRYEYSVSNSRDIENQYPTMSLDELKAMPIDNVALDDCVMLMWTTSPKLKESFEVLDAWGFEYRTNAVWDKEKIGMGYYFRQQHELLLVATRGSVPTPQPADRVSSVIRAPRGQHSKKPDLLYDLIDSMYPDLEKLEVFARNQREGWQSWGNQSDE